MKRNFILAFLLACGLHANAQQPAATPQQQRARGRFQVGDITTDPGVRDPCMAKEGDTYYVYFTGGGIQVWSTKDMKTFKKEPSVFSEAPAWVAQKLPSFRGLGFWAPDLSFHNGTWYLYYATSIFGKNTSVIGLATNKTLDPKSKDYKWVDQGMVMQSVTGRDSWNAIDPNLAVDESGTPWLTFGSHWNGLKMVKLSSDFKTPVEPQEWHTVAARPRDIKYNDEEPGNGALEAPFVFKKDKYYYLFLSWDACCAGPRSTYNVRVGRSEKITGPYLDKDGVDLAKGGGTFVRGGDPGGDDRKIYARGHNSAHTFDGVDYMAYHMYTTGYERLGIDKITWVDGWPTVKQ